MALVRSRSIIIGLVAAALLGTYVIWRFLVFYAWNAFIIGDRFSYFRTCSITWTESYKPCSRSLALFIANTGWYQKSETAYVDFTIAAIAKPPPPSETPMCYEQTILHLGNKGTAFYFGDGPSERRQEYMLKPDSDIDPGAFARSARLHTGSPVSLCAYLDKRQRRGSPQYFELRANGKKHEVFRTG